MAIQDDIQAALAAGDLTTAEQLISRMKLEGALSQILTSIRSGAVSIIINDWSKIREFWDYSEPKEYSPEAVFPIAREAFRSIITLDTPPEDADTFFALAAVIGKATRAKT